MQTTTTASEITAQLRQRTVAELCELFEETDRQNPASTEDQLALADVRGWIMDALQAKDSLAFGAWIDSDDFDKSPRPFFCDAAHLLAWYEASDPHSSRRWTAHLRAYPNLDKASRVTAHELITDYTLREAREEHAHAFDVRDRFLERYPNYSECNGRTNVRKEANRVFARCSAVSDALHRADVAYKLARGIKA